MKTYKVHAKRWDRGWELHIPDVGVTQSHGLWDAEAMVSDYIEMRTGAPVGTFQVHLVPEIGDGLDEAAILARDAVRQAEQAQRAAAAQSRDIARRLRQHGLSGRDISKVLGLSPQRVSQLLRGQTLEEAEAVTATRVATAPRPDATSHRSLVSS